MYKHMTFSDGKQVICLNDITYIPNDPMNRDWIEYQTWLSLGNTPEEV